MSGIPESSGQCPTLSHLFFRAVERFDHAAFLSHAPGGNPANFSTAQFRDAVLAVAAYFRRCGLGTGDRVALLSENRPEWHIADFAILLSGLVSVPVYPTLSPSQISYALNHCRARVLLVSGKKLLGKVAPVLAGIPSIEHVITMDPDAGAACGIAAESFTSVIEREREQGASLLPELRKRALETDPATLASIVYTSGTTGNPKGVMLSHGNFAFDLAMCDRRLTGIEVDQALSVLPLSHVFERIICYGYFDRGIPIAYGDPYELLDHFRRYRPGVLGCVPRILEKIREAAFQQIQALPAWKQKLVPGLMKLGVEGIEKNLSGRRATLRGKLLRPLVDLLVYRKIRARMGGRLLGMICGGASLSVEVEEFFFAAGLIILQGYGLTETAPVISFNPLGASRLGSVGPLLDGVSARIAADGELLVRGGNVMSGYYENPEATAQAFEDGWFRTGDLARFDEDGYLYISGRKKEIFVTSNGKNISYLTIENQLRSSRLIQEALVIGEGRRFLSALLIPDVACAARLAAQQGKRFGGDRELCSSPWLQALLAAELEEVQKPLADFERVKKFVVLQESVLHNTELVTPTQKVRRRHFEEHFRVEIEAMYRNI